MFFSLSLYCHLNTVCVQNEDTEMGRRVPKWVGTGIPDQRLPKTFHANGKMAETLTSWLDSEPYWTPEKWLVRKVDCMTIAESLGRAYREIQGALEQEPGTPPPSTDKDLWDILSRSKLGVLQLDALNTTASKIIQNLAKAKAAGKVAGNTEA